MDIDKLFKEYFPTLSQEFNLTDIQKKIIDKILSGENTLGIIPTGGGKSLIYWLSGLSFKGITLVISPLIALIDEQSKKIQDQGYNVLTLHGGSDPKKQINVLKQLYNKEINPDFIFVSPERIATDGFFEFCIKDRKDEIKLITIDEAHCVSQWGFDFRPFYKRIPDFLNSVFSCKWPIILGLTATINPKDIAEICIDFNIDKSNVIRDDYLLRGEIEIKAIKFTDEDEKEEKLWQLLDIHKNEKTIVYLYRKYKQRGIEDLRDKAIAKGYKAIDFHGDTPSEERQQIIDDYKKGNIDVIFATNAFGMGIDIKDIRVVIHFMIPESVEQYYQEIGRSARDKKSSKAYILYTNKNIQVRKSYFIDKSFPNIEKLHKVYKKISDNKPGVKTLKYFDDEEIQNCLSYFLNHNVVSIKAKGMTGLLDIFSEITNKDLEILYNLTGQKGIISIIKKSGKFPSEIVKIVYSSIIDGSAKLKKSFDKCLIIENHCEKLEEVHLKKICDEIEEKRNYKYTLLDYFVYILDRSDSSNEIHQEIGLYLGVDKHKVGKIYKTLKGDMVRSKSEVIIANILFNEKINYEYEKELHYKAGAHPIKPDFTIYVNGNEYYWEHLGMVGIEEYDNRWQWKKQIYKNCFPEQLIITYESTNLSQNAKELIERIKNS